jgi:hypothetical protein
MLGWVAWLVIALVGAGVWWGAFQLSRRWLPGVRSQRVWSVADGTPAPTDFLFLMFPKDDNVPVYESRGGKQVGTLKRALGNDVGELSDQWVGGPALGTGPEEQGAKRGYVRTEDLRYLSTFVLGTAPPGQPADKRINYVGEFAKAYMNRHKGESPEVKFMLYTERPPGLDREAQAVGEDAKGRYVSLMLKVDGNRREFFARVTGDKAVPLALDRLSEASKSASVVTRNMVAACIATTIAALAVVMAAGVLRHRQDRLPGQ